MVKFLICSGNMNEYINIKNKLGIAFEDCAYVHSVKDVESCPVDVPVLFHGTYWRRTDYTELVCACSNLQINTFSLLG